MMSLESVRMCPELLREMIALSFGKQSLVYAILHEMTRGGSGLVAENALVARVALAAGVQERTVKRHYLPFGDGWLWRRGKGKVGVIAPEKVARTVAQMSVGAGRLDVLATNPLGTKFIEIPLGNMLEQWCGYVLAAWHNSRADHTANISRFALVRLFNVTTKTLIRWEKSAGIVVTACYATYTDDEHIPHRHAYPTLHCVGNQVEIRATARHSNIYNAPPMNEVQHHMIPRLMRRAVRAVLKASTQVGTPDRTCGLYPETGEVGFRPTGRRNFTHGAGKSGFRSGFKRLADHFKHDDDDEAAHFVQLGYSKRLNTWLFEQSADGKQRTNISDRLPPDVEDRYFEQHGGRGNFINAWREFAT